MSKIKKACICAICIALCYVLPVALHSFGLGSILSPMHIPVLLCGLVCGGFYGAFCGIAGPIVSSILSGMTIYNRSTDIRGRPRTYSGGVRDLRW